VFCGSNSSTSFLSTVYGLQSTISLIAHLYSAFFVRTQVFGVVDERVVETGFKRVSMHVINYGSPKSVTKTHHEPNILFWCESSH